LYYINIKTREEKNVIDDLFSGGGLIAGLITIAAGIVILIWPKILPYILGIYLIVVGVAYVIAAVI
jgi:uncharacterized membrane protein HdeD (DUF308 family)